MLSERRIKRVEGSGQGRYGVCWSVKLEVADPVIGLKLRVVERANSDPGSLVVLVCSAECMASLFKRP